MHRNIITNDRKMLKILENINDIKDLNINVLIAGESGTGKELVAEMLHYGGVRGNNEFQVLNCAAIPNQLLESELFGHEAGAFTGASKKYRGKFELAHKGTLLLDEIGEMDIQLQAKLLRVIQNKKITPVGSEKSFDVDVRILSATNKNLMDSIEKRTFRDDLLYRLNTVYIELPSLRERIEDIPLLIEYFISKYSAAFRKKKVVMETEALEQLKKYRYPGNVRELENIMARCIAMAREDRIALEHLPEYVVKAETFAAENAMIPVYLGEDLKTIEERVIKKTLEYCKGNKRRTAKILGMSERNLHMKTSKKAIISQCEKNAVRT